MALAPLRQCPAAGCRTLTRGRRCERHAKERSPENRPSSSARGYDKRWSNKKSKDDLGTGVRDLYVQAHPVCEDCEKRGETKAVEEVHHIKKVADQPDHLLDETNLMSLCKSCHSRRTARGE